MMIELDSPAPPTRRTSSRTSTAFIVESLVLLVFLVGSLAVVTSLFTASANKATTSKHLERAVILASNTAEQFSANPNGVEEQSVVGDLAVSCIVTPTRKTSGTLYEATISVFDKTGQIYSLTTSRYMSGGEQ